MNAASHSGRRDSWCLMESAGALFGSVNTGGLGSIECHCPAFGDCILHPLSQEEASAALASPGCQGCWCNTPSSGCIESWLLLCLPMCLPARLCCVSLDSPLSWDGRSWAYEPGSCMGPPQKSLGLAEWQQGHGGCAKEGREPHRSLQLCVTASGSTSCWYWSPFPESAWPIGALMWSAAGRGQSSSPDGAVSPLAC